MDANLFSEASPARARGVVMLDQVAGRKAMVVLSGGLDSTWALWTLLTKTQAEVYAHHVDYRRWSPDPNDDTRQRLERQASEAVVRWLWANVRRFRFTTSTLDLRGLDGVTADRKTPLLGSSRALRDVVAVATQAALAAWKVGFGGGDFIISGRNTQDVADAEKAARIVRRLDAVPVPFYDCLEDCPTVGALNPLPTRRRQVEDVPPDLFALTWSCLSPRPLVNGEYAECGRCDCCRQLRFAHPRYMGAALVAMRATQARAMRASE